MSSTLLRDKDRVTTSIHDDARAEQGNGHQDNNGQQWVDVVSRARAKQNLQYQRLLKMARVMTLQNDRSSCRHHPQQKLSHSHKRRPLVESRL